MIISLKKNVIRKIKILKFMYLTLQCSYIPTFFVSEPSYPKNFMHSEQYSGSYGLYIPIFKDDKLTEMFYELFGHKKCGSYTLNQYYQRFINGEN